MAQPFATLQKAANVVVAGDTVWIRGGTYNIVTPATSGAGVNITKSGTSDSNRIKFWAYPGELPIFDFSKMVISTTGYTSGFAVSGSWLHFKGLEIRNVPMNTRSNTGFGVNDPAHDDIFELMNFHHNNGSGFFISHGGGGHLILNCDSHDNYDPTSSQGDGQNSDGFGAHYQESGKVTTFRGCRAWWNSDDGWDLISQEYPVVIEQSWAFGNGYIESGTKRPADGNGNGFKAGSSKTGIRHIVRNNLAWGNAAAGFYANHSSGGNDWYNNTAYDNGTQFNLLASTWDADGNRTDGVTLSGALAHKMRNNIGFPNKNSYVSGYGVDTASNTWDLSITPAASDFASVTDTGFMGPRQADGSLPNLDFMKLRSGSKMIDKGTNVGLAYVGSAPDLGAYEFGAVTGGGAASTGGSPSTGGAPATGGAAGAPASGGAGGVRSSGGSNSGGMPGTSGGSQATGGTSSGGLANNTGGLSNTGGTASAGGSGVTTGGTVSGGAPGASSGGTIAVSGGTNALGGTPTAGGAPATGGTTGPGTVPTDPADSGSCSCSVPGGARPPYGAGLVLSVLALALNRMRRSARIRRQSR
ncbi:MAG TPA: right-handed parallel beta-helix repeat-containing protein [Polyangiaceae bacterium]|nr:right-handed parallel beta-helix repeat-containing protein [Polyangiaceae bacterium]